MEDGFMMIFQEENQRELRKKVNEYTGQFGLQFTEDDIKELYVRRGQCLLEQQRVEFGKSILEALIFAFCDSSFIDQENYLETIARLQDIFYLYKNESMDELTDEELIDFMRDAFDEECQGSLEYLEETCLEQFARDIRANTRRFIGRYAKTDE